MIVKHILGAEMKAKHSISAFFPAYNDAGTIAHMVASAKSILESITDDYEIIVVDDGSVDETGQILDQLAKNNSFLHVVHHPTNRGYGGALRTGFATATKDLIFYTDGDGQYDVFDLPKIYDLLSDDVDIVQAYKTNRSDSWVRKLVGRIYQQTVKLLFQLRVRDVDCDFRLMRRRIFAEIVLNHDSGVICVELVKKIQDRGFSIVEAGVAHYPRTYGRSQFFRIRPLFHTLRDLTDLWIEIMVLSKFGSLVHSQPHRGEISKA